jgi:hypothetical protein
LARLLALPRRDTHFKELEITEKTNGRLLFRLVCTSRNKVSTGFVCQLIVDNAVRQFLSTSLSSHGLKQARQNLPF